MCTSCSSAANTHILPPLSSLASMLLFTETDHLSRTVYLLCINLFEQHATALLTGPGKKKGCQESAFLLCHKIFCLGMES